MTTLPSPVYMLAIDHRWQWVKWCDEHRIDHARIREVKRLAADAFLLARRDWTDAMESGVLLSIFSSDRSVRPCPGRWRHRRNTGGARGRISSRVDRHIRQGAARGVRESAGPPPRGSAARRRRNQLAMLEDLQQWCSAKGKPLVIEVLVSGETEDAAFDREGRPRLLADYVRRGHARKIVPQYWKIEGVPDAAAMRIVDDAILERDGPRQLILGKGAGLETVGTWFESARGAASAAGFAIGRTVYREPACEYLLGRAAADDAVHRMSANYLTVIELWRRAHPA